MDFQALGQKYTEIYDGYTNLAQIMPGFHSKGILSKYDMDALIPQYFDQPADATLTQKEAEGIKDKYFSCLGALLKGRLAAQIDLYQSNLLQGLTLKRSDPASQGARLAEFMGEFAHDGIKLDIENTIGQLQGVTNAPSYDDLVERMTEMRTAFDEKPLHPVNNVVAMADEYMMFDLGCDADLGLAETALNISNLQLSMFYLVSKNPVLKTMMVANTPIEQVFQRTRDAVHDFSTAGAESLKAAGEIMEAAYDALAPENSLFDAGLRYE